MNRSSTSVNRQYTPTWRYEKACRMRYAKQEEARRHEHTIKLQAQLIAELGKLKVAPDQPPSLINKIQKIKRKIAKR